MRKPEGDAKPGNEIDPRREFLYENIKCMEF